MPAASPVTLSQTGTNNCMTFDVVLKVVNSELQNVSRDATDSVLRQKSFNSMRGVDFESVVKEIERLCPLTYQLLSVMIEEKYDRAKSIPPFALIFAIIMFRRNKKLSRLQRVNTVLLTESGANMEVNTIYTCNIIIY